MPMGDSKNLYCIRLFSIDKCKWKTPQDEFPAAVLANWPTLRSRENHVRCSIYLVGEAERCGLASFLIPTERRFQFVECGWMNFQRLSGH